MLRLRRDVFLRVRPCAASPVLRRGGSRSERGALAAGDLRLPAVLPETGRAVINAANVTNAKAGLIAMIRSRLDLIAERQDLQTRPSPSQRCSNLMVTSS